MTRKITLIAAAAAIALSGLSMTPTEAEAGKGRYQQWEFETKRPVRGYEGFAGINKTYCSYRREPVRKCWYSRNGYEKCRVVSWRLIQKCYD